MEEHHDAANEENPLAFEFNQEAESSRPKVQVKNEETQLLPGVIFGNCPYGNRYLDSETRRAARLAQLRKQFKCGYCNKTFLMNSFGRHHNSKHQGLVQRKTLVEGTDKLLPPTVKSPGKPHEARFEKDNCARLIFKLRQWMDCSGPR